MIRRILGATLSCVLVGEITVAPYNGLFTPAGLVVLLYLYIVYFMLLDALVRRYQLNTAYFRNAALAGRSMRLVPVIRRARQV